MKYTKIPLEHISQIEILKDRGLIIEDERFALEKLNVISYYRLANYWRPMEADKVHHIFKPNSRFSDIYNLYTFDKKLRALIFSITPQLPSSLSRNWLKNTFVLEYKIYSLLCCIAYLLDRIEKQNDFKERLVSLINTYSNVDVRAMGFSEGWQDEPLWRKA